MSDIIFFSYAASDRERIESAIAQFQKTETAKAYVAPNSNLWAADFQPGDDFRASIRDRVRSANQVVVFWSAKAATSPHVQYELGMADALDKPITIVQLDQTQPELPAHLLGNMVRLEDLTGDIHKS
jgi:TIR domain